MVEVLVSMALTLVIALAVFQFVDSSRRMYVKQSDKADSQSVGRAALDLLSAELRGAGYDPLGMDFDALPEGTATSLRVLADLDGDGDVTSAGEANENLTWVFTGPNADGLYTLSRGVDLNVDRDFTDTDESVDEVSPSIVQIDFDGDSTNEPFLSYNFPPPNTTQVRVTFGIRADHYDFPKGPSHLTFHSH